MICSSAASFKLLNNRKIPLAFCEAQVTAQLCNAIALSTSFAQRMFEKSKQVKNYASRLTMIRIMAI